MVSSLCDRIIDCERAEAHASLPALWEVPVSRSTASKPPRPVKAAAKNGNPRPAKAPAAAKPVEGKKRRGRPPRSATDAAQETFPGERLIHRYGNRRFYDLRQSRAVTLEELAEIIRGGETVRVIDVQGSINIDITKRVLTQIILEDQNEGRLAMVPVELLNKLITMRDIAMGTWLEQYLAAGAKFLDRSANATLPAAAVLQETLSQMFSPFKPATSGDAAPAAASANVPPDVANEVRELRRRLDEITREKSRR
jgi:polyhydroxyalkanoate synthesis repressor PhaR